MIRLRAARVGIVCGARIRVPFKGLRNVVRAVPEQQESGTSQQRHDEEYIEVQEGVDVGQAQQVYASAPPPSDGAPELRVAGTVIYATVGFFALTFLITTVNYVRKFNTNEAKKRRMTLRNQKVVGTLNRIYPEHRDVATERVLFKLRLETAFTYPEIFRKFLWFVLRDRKFDTDAVDDLLHLKGVMKLSNDDVAEALTERATRIEAKFGNLMLSTEGLSQKAVQRKASGRALFSKLLYLVENDALLQPCDACSVDVIRDIFGATEDDIARLRIVSLQEVDMDKLDSMASNPEE